MMTQSADDSWIQELLFEQNSYASSQPALGLYVGIILVYILVVLPGLFLYLRKKDRMHYLRELLILTALLFSAIIFVLGAKTRLTAPALNYVRVLDQREAVYSETIYISVQIPYRQNMTAAFDGSYQVMELEPQEDETQGHKRQNDGLKITEDDEMITISTQDCTAVAPMYLKLSRMWTSDEDTFILQADQWDVSGVTLVLTSDGGANGD
jgi:hypothetical protein